MESTLLVLIVVVNEFPSLTVLVEVEREKLGVFSSTTASKTDTAVAGVLIPLELT